MSTPERRTDDQVRGLAAFAGFLLFLIAVVALHVVQPELPPGTTAVSYYVHGPHGWWLTVGLLGLATGSLALTSLLHRAYDGGGRAVVNGGLLLWSLGLIGGAIFPADPMGHWNEPPSTAGLIHGSVAMVAFVALPVAALALARGLREDPRWRGAGGRLGLLGAACAMGTLLFFASLWPTLGADRPPVLLGLTERVLLLADLAWLVASTRQALRVASIA